jgi:hypothetical protein
VLEFPRHLFLKLVPRQSQRVLIKLEASSSKAWRNSRLRHYPRYEKQRPISRMSTASLLNTLNGITALLLLEYVFEICQQDTKHQFPLVGAREE